MPMPGAQKGPKRDRFSPRSLQSERIEVDYEELVLVKDSLDFLRILRLGQCQHEEDARLLRVVHHGAHKALLREFADGCHKTCSNAGINHDHDARLVRLHKAVHDGIGNIGVSEASVDDALGSDFH